MSVAKGPHDSRHEEPAEPGGAGPRTAFEAFADDAGLAGVDVLCVPVFQDADDLSDLSGLDAATGGEIARAREGGEFRARRHDLFLTPIVGAGWRARRVVLVGAGPRATFDATERRRVAAAVGYAARARGVTSLGWVVRREDEPLAAARAAADGLTAAAFDGGLYKGGVDRPAPYPVRVVVTAPGADPAALAAAVERGRIDGEAVNATRALAMEPANVLTPREFAARVGALAGAAGLGVEVLDAARLEALGMGLIAGLGRGSAEPPCLIVLRHEPAGAAGPVLGFAGKGVTFDTGGINLKPGDGMERMKSDMSGGAAVAAAMAALARLGAPRRIVAAIPAAENMPGPSAIRPGDVLRAASGSTVEVLNTDAEGRLLLADALWYLRELGATHLLDVATLTGACLVALGRVRSGLFGAPDDWCAEVAEAATAAGERVWRLPVDDDYRELLRSEVADLTNFGGRPGGASTAAAFLREFAGDGPWAHLDIAGTAWADERKPWQPKGPTGAGVRTLIELGMRGARPDPE